MHAHVRTPDEHYIVIVLSIAWLWEPRPKPKAENKTDTGTSLVEGMCPEPKEVVREEEEEEEELDTSNKTGKLCTSDENTCDNLRADCGWLGELPHATVVVVVGWRTIILLHPVVYVL